MIDISLIREKPELVKENIKKKFQDDKLKLVDEAANLDKEWREIKQRADDLRHERNTLTSQINAAKKAGKDTFNLIKKAKEIPEEIKKLEEQEKLHEEKIKEIMYKIPNIIHDSVPIGKDSSENVVRKVIGKPKKPKFEIKHHAEIAEKLGIADFETARETSGKGFYYFIGDLGLLNMALINYARDFMLKQGFAYVEPPLMIRERVLKGVYSNVEIAAMAYKVENEDLFLIATSEHPLIGMFIDKAIEKEKLPIKYTGYSMCFRREVGAHGLDEKGLYRTHQFNKQEMVVICEPEDSYKWYDKMLSYTIAIFKSLGIPVRVLECCSGDLGDLKAKSADVEAWSPRQQKYFEVGSITNMEEAQARRLNIKILNKDGTRYYAHTLNNTVIATSRALVAILENYQQKDGSVLIPKVLWKYMNGKKVIKLEVITKYKVQAKTIKVKKAKKRHKK